MTQDSAKSHNTSSGGEALPHTAENQLSKNQPIRIPTVTVIKAAAVQLSPVLYSREGTVDKVVQKIIELGRQGVQFATFPETVVPYYSYFSFVQRPFEQQFSTGFQNC